MSVEGSTIFRKIKETVSTLESEVNTLSASLSDTERNISQLNAENERAYTSLAAKYLPTLEQKSLESALKDVQFVRDIFERKQARRAEIDELVKQSNIEREKAEKELEQVVSSINENIKTRDERNGNVNLKLKADDNYTSLLSETKTIASKIEGYKERIATLEEEASKKDEKGRAVLETYTKNNRFDYLARRKFGTDEYERKYGKRKLIRKWDEWVAKEIGYSEQRKIYDLLVNMPKILMARIADRQSKIDGLIDSMKGIEKKYQDECELTPVLETLDALQKQKAQYQQAIETANKNNANYLQERQNLDNAATDRFYQEANDRLKALFKGESIEKLKSRARETPDTEDDRLVDKIEKNMEQIRQYKDSAKKIQQDRESCIPKLERAKTLKSTYDRKDYEISDSYFNTGSETILQLITDHIEGSLDENDLWSRLKSHRRVRERESYDSDSFNTYHSTSVFNSSSRSSYSSSPISFGGGGGGGTHISIGGGGGMHVTGRRG